MSKIISLPDNRPNVTLCIKWNNLVAHGEPCAICGSALDPKPGPELFIEGTWELVCLGCGMKAAPELVYVLAKLAEAEMLMP